MSKDKKDNYYFRTEKGMRDASFFVEHYQAESVLDYGCGETKLNINGIVNYDPFIERHSKEPIGNYDVVFCHNVLNQVKQKDLPDILSKIYSLTKKAAVFNIQFPGVYETRFMMYNTLMNEAGFKIKEKTTTKLESFLEELSLDSNIHRESSWDYENIVFYILVEK
jgi:2-polyprenyl-3-methyl-5-hydroxy-6-metoxy-1,4-benzoquinol methylase